MNLRSMALAPLLFVLSCKTEPPPPSPRCPVDLAALEVFSATGTGALAKKVESPDDLIGGNYAHGRVGDVLIANDKIRVLLEQPSRAIGPQPYGGTIIDADVVRPAGEPGRDQFGELGVLYSFGRTLNVRSLDILSDGSQGGPAVVAATGDDAVNDYLSVPNQMMRLLGGRVELAINPELPIKALVTTYYVLSPGERRVRILTAFCNNSDQGLTTVVGDLVDRGDDLHYFNPRSCTGGMGATENKTSCVIQPTPWYGLQGDKVAYAVRSMSLDDLRVPDSKSAAFTAGGITVTLAEGEDFKGILSWLDKSASKHPGAFVIRPNSARYFLRDFVVGRDLGEVYSSLLEHDGVPLGTLDAVVRDAAGAGVPGARVSVASAATGQMFNLLVADDSGRVTSRLPPGDYALTLGLEGHPLSTVQATVVAEGTVSPTLTLGGSRRLTVNVQDPFGAPLPAKVTVLCAQSPCQFSASQYLKLYELEALPSEVAAIAFVPPHGRLELALAPGEYQLLVSRGIEYSLWPDTAPLRGEAVDLRTQDQTRTATLGRVIDTVGWLSADLHVHSVNSSDASVPNELRVLDFAAEGVDVLSSSDHDYITDFAPYVRRLGAEKVLASMVGAEVTPFDWGHYNSYPVTPGEGINGGAFDWAGGEGPTLRPQQMIEQVKERSPGAVVQMNHPRGPIGSLTLLKVDTATLASHAPPSDFRMEPSPEATATDTRLFSVAFDAMEVIRGVDGTEPGNLRVFNDWMTFLSRGTVRTATATSDTHYATVFQGGYPRTYVSVATPDDDLSQFEPLTFAAQLKAMHALGTNGPFLKVTAKKLDGSGQPVGNAAGMGDTLSLSPAAGEKLELEVEVQALEWMTFDSLELYSHADGREAYEGDDNFDWPASRILDKKVIDVTALPIEPVVINGKTFRRLHFTERFVTSPTRDDWFVVMLRSSSGAGSLFPLTFAGTSCGAGRCDVNAVQPFAFTNPVFVDADGSGRYDQYPQKSLRIRRHPLKQDQAAPSLTIDEIAARLDAELAHH